MHRLSNKTYRFDSFTLDLARGCLLRGEQEVKLRPKVFDALCCLVENNKRLVTKAELIAAVWPDSFVTDDSLVQCLVELRRALGDDGQECIKTVPRRGYIFDAVVTSDSAAGEAIYTEQVEGVRIVIEEEDDREPTINDRLMRADTLALPPVSRTPWRKPAAIGLVLVPLIAGVVIGVLYFRSSGELKPSAPGTQVRSIAVLPFKPLNPDGSDEYLGLGMADTLITKLSNLRQIIVRPTSAVRKYTAPDQDSLAAGREQGVDAVLEASFQKLGDKVRLTARLLNVKDGSSLWSYKCDEYCSDIFALQDAVSERVAGALALELTGEERKLLTKRYTENAQAYELYLKGRLFLNKRTSEGTQKAAEFFRRALEIDPNDALAYLGLADCCFIDIFFTSASPPRDLISKGKAMARKALELDETLGEAHTMLSILADTEWDWKEAVKEGQQAINLSPGSARAHQLFAFTIAKRGRLDEALTEIRKARDLDPLNLVIRADIAEILCYAGRYDEAIEQCHKALELEPNFSMAYAFLGVAYWGKGMYKEALGPLQRSVELEGEGSLRSIHLAMGYGFAGEKEKAQAFLKGLRKRPKTEYTDPTWVAVLYIAIGDNDKALDWIEKACAERSPTATALMVDSRFTRLRTEPRYQALLSRMGFEPQ